ncbi:hypothetical protein [Natrinema sp. 74]|uniref:hypothetical protein n=1 Tax=Natrinema sp. 74 TaxID=3384159 RepID=UPI0038D3B218
MGGVWAAASEEIRSQGVSNVVVEKNLGTLQGMTTGAGKSIDSLRALYNDPIGSITALREIPAAILNFRAIIAAIPQSIEDKQKQNNPHDPDENSKLYQSYRMGWYEGYIAWFVIESSIPTGKAGKAVKSSKRFQKVADSISTPKIRRAAKLATRAKRGKTTALRYGKLQLSRGLSTGIGVTKKTGERILSPVPTVGKQYRVSKLLDRQDIDGEKLNRHSPDEQRKIGEFTNRYGDDGAELASDGGPVFQQIVTSDTLDAATTDRIVRAYDQHIIDEDDIQRIARGLDEGDIDQQAVTRGLTRAQRLSQDHDVTALRVGSDANTRDPYYAVWYGKVSQSDLVDGELPDNYRPNDDYPGYSPPHKSSSIVVEAKLESESRFVRVHGEEIQQGPWMMPVNEFRNAATNGGKSALEDRYALLDGTPKYVSEVTVPEGEQIRVSIVGRQGELSGGGTQIEVRRYHRGLEEKWFPQKPTSVENFINGLK